MPRFEWDKEVVRVFCEICKEECEKGNRPQGHLTSTGYSNLMLKLLERIGRRPSREQCKNKWDQLKREYQQFMQLKNSATGLGWNAQRGIIGADDSWWTTHLQNFPKHAKYRSASPDNLEQMEVMYDKAYVTGELSTPAGRVDLGSHRSTDQDLAFPHRSTTTLNQQPASPPPPASAPPRASALTPSPTELDVAAAE